MSKHPFRRRLALAAVALVAIGQKRQLGGGAGSPERVKGKGKAPAKVT